MFAKNENNKNAYHWKPDNIKYLPKYKRITLKSVPKYHSCKIIRAT